MILFYQEPITVLLDGESKDSRYLKLRLWIEETIFDIYVEI